MQTCTNWDLKLFTAMVVKMKLLNCHSSGKGSIATTCNSLKVGGNAMHFFKTETGLLCFWTLSEQEGIVDEIWLVKASAKLYLFVLCN